MSAMSVSFVTHYIALCDPKTKNVEDALPISLEGVKAPATSSHREAVISGSAASTGSHHRFPITGPVILASHPLPEERQEPCNSVNALCMNKWLAIEKDAEIEVATSGWGFHPDPV
jgi:hypothetical protein